VAADRSVPVVIDPTAYNNYECNYGFYLIELFYMVAERSRFIGYYKFVA
jgi:hypothetical protein